MINGILLSIGAISVIVWGISHLFPTRSVVKGFGDISVDNKRIIRMEWINEGFTLIFIGLLILIIHYFGDKNSTGHIQKLVYSTSAIMLFAMAILSLFTGAKIKFLPFRLCPIIFSISAILILLGTFL